MSDFYDSIATDPKLFNEAEQAEVNAYIAEMEEDESVFMAKMKLKMAKRAKAAQKQQRESKKKS